MKWVEVQEFESDQKRRAHFNGRRRGRFEGFAAGWFLACVFFGLVAGLTSCDRREPVMSGQPIAMNQQNGADVTFFFCADTHHSPTVQNLRNRAQVQAMNALPGELWPDSVGGIVGVPFGVFVGGDLTNEVTMPAESLAWDLFLDDYEGDLNFPLYELHGNHDRAYAQARIIERHGDLVYRFEYGGVWFYILGEEPTVEISGWLSGELDVVGSAPVVLFHHYGMDSVSTDCDHPASPGRCFDPVEQAAYVDAIQGHNIIGVFHGHFHRVGYEEHFGTGWYRPGSSQYDTLPFGNFYAARIAGDTLTVARYHWNMDSGGTFTYGRWKDVYQRSTILDPPSGIKLSHNLCPNWPGLVGRPGHTCPPYWNCRACLGIVETDSITNGIGGGPREQVQDIGGAGFPWWWDHWDVVFDLWD